MSARRLIIFCLLMLQGIAPLVHAHVQLQDHLQGIHMHTFVQADPDLNTPSAQAIVTADQVLGLHAAIKQKHAFDEHSELSDCLLAAWPPLPSRALLDGVNFSPHIQPINAFTQLVIAAPRAPPL